MAFGLRIHEKKSMNSDTPLKVSPQGLKMTKNQRSRPEIFKNSEKFRKCPNASERTETASNCIQTHPNASERIRTGPNTFKNDRKRRNVHKNFAKLRENFAKLRDRGHHAGHSTVCLPMLPVWDRNRWRKVHLPISHSLHKLPAGGGPKTGPPSPGQTPKPEK